MVKWDGGGNVNFRGHLRDNQLFLRDHRGQASHLHRLLE